MALMRISVRRLIAGQALVALGAAAALVATSLLPGACGGDDEERQPVATAIPFRVIGLGEYHRWGEIKDHVLLLAFRAEAGDPHVDPLADPLSQFKTALWGSYEPPGNSTRWTWEMRSSPGSLRSAGLPATRWLIASRPLEPHDLAPEGHGSDWR
ncbi:MAG: hypothetical protein ACR2HN_00700 [Tepidiformaceae bacterium]